MSNEKIEEKAEGKMELEDLSELQRWILAKLCQTKPEKIGGVECISIEIPDIYNGYYQLNTNKMGYYHDSRDPEVRRVNDLLPVVEAALKSLVEKGLLTAHEANFGPDYWVLTAAGEAMVKTEEQILAEKKMKYAIREKLEQCSRVPLTRLETHDVFIHGEDFSGTFGELSEDGYLYMGSVDDVFRYGYWGDVRVYINPEITAEQAVKTLRQLAGYIERDECLLIDKEDWKDLFHKKNNGRDPVGEPNRRY